MATSIIEEPQCTSSFFSRYPNFVPDPDALLHDEIDRLAVQEAWHGRKKRERRVAAYTAEIALQCSGKSKLERWQALCVDVGVAAADSVPTTVKRCKKALMSVTINLCNLVDHRRNSNIALLHFKTFRDFVRYTRRGHVLPKSAAEHDVTLKSLFKKFL